jgi:hypothetical protein
MPATVMHLILIDEETGEMNIEYSVKAGMHLLFSQLRWLTGAFIDHAFVQIHSLLKNLSKNGYL